MHHHLLRAASETANVLELRQSFYTAPPLGGGGGVYRSGLPSNTLRQQGAGALYLTNEIGTPDPN